MRHRLSPTKLMLSLASSPGMPIRAQSHQLAVEVATDGPAHVYHHRFAVQGFETVFDHCELVGSQPVSAKSYTATLVSVSPAAMAFI